MSYCRLSTFNNWHIRSLKYSIEFSEDIVDEEFSLDDGEIDDVEDVEVPVVYEDVKR